MGIALGNAWASPQTGDTVGSVMIGGLRTILNGDFQISTGDLLMFYWPDERFLFEDNGGRVARKTLCMDDANNVLDWRKVTAFIMDDKLNNKDMALEPQGMSITFFNHNTGILLLLLLLLVLVVTGSHPMGRHRNDAQDVLRDGQRKLQW